MKKIINNNTNLSEEGVRIKTLGQIACYSPYADMRDKAMFEFFLDGERKKMIKSLMKENRELREQLPPDFKL